MRSETNPRPEKNDQGKNAPAPLRCCCGSLLARLVPGGVELKCRRCKRQIVIALESRTAM